MELFSYVMVLASVIAGLANASHFASLGSHYSIGAIAFPILYVIGMITRRRNYHASIAVVSLVDHASQAFQNFWFIG
jgi:hypothetical protein